MSSGAELEARARVAVGDVLAARRDAGSAPGERRDGHRVALVIEGGGMRGVVSGGMALAFAEAGMVGLFDDVYGASAGSISGAWLLSSSPEGLRGWTDPRWARRLIGARNLLRGKPMIDVAELVERVYVDDFPIDYDSVLASPVPLHPIATDCVRAEAVDLQPVLGDDPVALRLALRASAALPIVGGRPVTFGDQILTDAGLVEPVPFRSAIRAGATHVVVLRSRHRDSERSGDVTGWRRRALGAALSATGHPRAVTGMMATRAERAAVDDEVLRKGWAHGAAGAVPVLTIWPDTSEPTISRTEKEGDVLAVGFEHGRARASQELQGIV